MFDELHDKQDIESRLRLFEQVRRNRASAVQTLSNCSPPASQTVLDAAAKYLPDGKRLENMSDVNEYLWSFDVVEECKAVRGDDHHGSEVGRYSSVSRPIAS